MLPSGMLGEVGLVSGGTRDEFKFHSPGLRHANVTAITGAYFTLDISRRMNGVVCAGKDTRASKRGWDTRTSSTRCVIQSSHTVGVRAGLLAASSRSIKLRWV